MVNLTSFLILMKIVFKNNQKVYLDYIQSFSSFLKKYS